MKTVTIKLPDGYDEMITLTALGTNQNDKEICTSAIVGAFVLEKGTNIEYLVQENGWKQEE